MDFESIVRNVKVHHGANIQVDEVVLPRGYLKIAPLIADVGPPVSRYA